MKNPYLIPVTAVTLLFITGCDKKSSGTAEHVQELERKANEAEYQQKVLQRQLEEQKLAAERDAIERDRLQLENDRAELERQEGDAAAAKAEEIRQREAALANREGKLEQIQANLEEEQSELANRGEQLNDRERDLAGREALPFQDEEQTVPVGDYGIFYDSLSSYGSWFETPDYGYVWQPVVVTDSNWRPYSRGRWVCTDRGWTWVSDEPFGWATYHYGRWALVRGRGWVWVPGTEWAPCWVSWRENRNHIGWAPLPPETMAYRNHRWDSSVDVQFGIGASWFTFVEVRHFGSALYQHCLPLSQNTGCYGTTTNITYLHFQNRQVICGGPRYKDVCDRIGRPIPFCRLEIDRHPRPGGQIIGTRPQVKGDRLLVSAPNIDADWNGRLKPSRIKGRMDAMVVERNEPLRPEIAERYRKNREENGRIAERSIQQLGGVDQFRERRTELLDENRKQVVNGNRKIAPTTDQARRDGSEVAARETRELSVAPATPQEPNGKVIGQGNPRPGTMDQNDPRRPGIGTPGVYPREGQRPQQQRPAVLNPVADASDEPTSNPPREPKEPGRRPAEQPRVEPQEDNNQRQRQADRMRENPQQGAEQQQQRETARQRQQEQARQQQDQQQAREELQKQRQAEQEREARKAEMEQQREQARQRQQEESRQQQQEQARQEQAQQQREMERQQERSRQQQEDNQRQRQEEQNRQRQQENQRQQDEARQRQQDNDQRQRQQQEKDQKDEDEKRKRNR